MIRAGLATIDLGKDTLSAVGYFRKGYSGMSMKSSEVNSTVAWDLGITWFLAIYTALGMFIPAAAYMAMFSAQLKDFKGARTMENAIYWCYTFLSPILSPFIGVIRYLNRVIMILVYSMNKTQNLL